MTLKITTLRNNFKKSEDILKSVLYETRRKFHAFFSFQDYFSPYLACMHVLKDCKINGQVEI